MKTTKRNKALLTLAAALLLAAPSVQAEDNTVTSYLQSTISDPLSPP
ncbi:MAG: hypothetical protein NTW21_40775 [Verrucomicrobia bacterium]|nr:hypothetical protein [Verrucomicrobiota bacterium]